jgi:hypothetical protein
MLRFTAGALNKGRFQKDAWVYIESFLIHFRNLVEFLGNPDPRTKGVRDLHVTTIWAREGLQEPEILSKLHNDGRQLFELYERQEDRISRFLAHCTEERIDFKEWSIDKMCEEIEPLLDKSEKRLQPSPEFETAMVRIPPVDFSDGLTASTQVYTPTATAAILPSLERESIP